MPEPTSTKAAGSCTGECDDMAAVRERLGRGDNRMTSIEGRLETMQSDVSEVLEILKLGRSFFKLAGYLGAFVKWATPIGAAAWSIYQIFKNGGKS